MQTCRPRKLFVILLCWGITLILFFGVVSIYNPPYDYLPTRFLVNKETKYVLYWTPFWFHKDWKMGFGLKPFENCEYKNCYATNDRRLLPIEEFHSIIFHATVYSRKKDGVPQKRLPHQIYIYSNVEAPVNQCPDLHQYKSFFNWTMSYRFDSDIVWRHGTAVYEFTNYELPSQESLSSKTKLVAWFVNHCKTNSSREELGKAIQKYIPVDIYGKCGTLNCAKKKTDPGVYAPECYNMLEYDYKFYFSFENAYCRDYASEMLYNILQKNVVPVVYGADDYKISTPPHSVINAEDFQTVGELASYLSYLDKHTEEYLKYFEWKKTYKVLPLTPACQICKKLHESTKHSVYDDLHRWWWGEDQPVCKSKTQLPDIVSYILQ